MDDQLVELVYNWRDAFEKRGRHSYYNGYYFIRSCWADNDYGYVSLEINRKSKATFVDDKGYAAPITPLSALRAITQPILRPYRGFEKDSLAIHIEEGLLASSCLLSIQGNQRTNYDIRDFSMNSQPRAQGLIGAATELLERYKNQEFK